MVGSGVTNYIRPRFIIEIIILTNFPMKTIMRYIFCIAVFSRKFVKIIILLIKRSYIIDDDGPHHMHIKVILRDPK